MASLPDEEAQLRILAVAYSYNGAGKSESLVTYNLVRALESLGHEFVVLTRDRCFDDNVINLGQSKHLKQSSGIGKAHKTDYYPFIRRCHQFASQNLAKFDVIQHLSPISLRYHNPLASLNRPFVWGPIGGSIPYPPGFSSAQHRESLVQRLRALDVIRLRLDPLLIGTLKRARRIICTTHASAKLLPTRYENKTVVIPEGIDERDVMGTTTVPEDFIFSSGRLVPYKAFNLLIKAFAASDCHHRIRLVITGTGPEASYLKEVARAEGVAERVEMLGQVSRDVNLGLMRRSLFCVFPALNEAFGSVNLEAMASGRTVVVTDWAGPSDLVTNDFDGFKIYPTTETQYVRDLSKRIDHLASDDSDRRRLEDGARTTVQRHLWANIARRYDAIFQDCVHGLSREIPGQDVA